MIGPEPLHGTRRVKAAAWRGGASPVGPADGGRTGRQAKLAACRKDAAPLQGLLLSASDRNPSEQAGRASFCVQIRPA